MKTIILRTTMWRSWCQNSPDNFSHEKQMPAATPESPAHVREADPKFLGEFKGGSEQSGFAFQDSAGTLRFVTNVPCGATPQIALEIHRTK